MNWNNLEFSFLNGRLLYVDNENDFIGYNPIFSKSMDFPADNSGNVKKAEHNISLGGNIFTVKIKYIERRSFTGIGLLGLEVFAENELLTTHLSFNMVPGNESYGSKWFYYKDCYYKISAGWNILEERYIGGEMKIPSDSVPIEKEFLKIKSNKIYLVKFNRFIGGIPKRKTQTIEDIVQDLLVHKNTRSSAIHETLEAWDLQLVKKIDRD